MFIKVLLISFACSTVQAREAKDKSALYAKYPQLLSENTDPCVRGLNQLLINMDTNMTAEIMTFQTMHGLDDLGRKSQC